MRRQGAVFGDYPEKGWGLTETSPLGTVLKIKPDMGELSKEECYELQAKQGCGVFGIEMGISDDNNKPLPWDGVAFVTLKVRGPWVASSYFWLEGAGSPPLVR